MLRLIKADLTTPGQRNISDRAPAGFLHFGAHDALGFQRRNLCFQIVAHQVKFLPFLALGRMHRRLGRWQRENQPAMAGKI